MNDSKRYKLYKSNKVWMTGLAGLVGLTLAGFTQSYPVSTDNNASVNTTTAAVNGSEDQNNDGLSDRSGADQSGLQTGKWGTADYSYNPDSKVLTVSNGELPSAQDSTANQLSNDIKNNIQTITFGDNVSAPEDSSNLFKNFANLNEVNGNLDTSKVTNMSYMFYGTTVANVDGLQNWDTSKVANMSEMFSKNKNLKNVDGLQNWNTSNVTDMSLMFINDNGLANVDGLKSWDTGNVIDMSDMFAGNASLVNLNGLQNWDTSKVTDMSGMFMNNASLMNANMRNWDTSEVTSMESMFYGDSQLSKIILGSKVKSIAGVGLDQAGQWARTDPSEPSVVYNSSQDFMSRYNGENPGVYELKENVNPQPNQDSTNGGITDKSGTTNNGGNTTNNSSTTTNGGTTNKGTTSNSANSSLPNTATKQIAGKNNILLGLAALLFYAIATVFTAMKKKKN